ncbi:MAG: hypothetical protein IPL79_13115 [Myxococcales bacterium]|nr:hypothetical protein [Myxococcales bacterium]
MRAVIALLLTCGLGASTHAPWSSPWWAEQAACYLDSASYRRASLEASLTNPSNSYSRHRLAFYGLGDRGWDALPVWNPRSVPLTRAMSDELARGTMPSMSAATTPLWDGARPEFALTRPELARQLGLQADGDGNPLGVVLFTDVDGTTRVGITCALCHTARGAQGAVVVGRARRELDYGAIRLAYGAATGEPIEPGLAKRLATWGPGRADVTEDNDEDPVAIPDLWGLRFQTTLTQAGTIANIGPVALAIRQETQLLHANRQRIRPPRELAWALARFVYELEPPPVAVTTTSPAMRSRGAAVFESECRHCHRNEAYGGSLIAATRVGTNPALAHGTARGTGYYRVPALLRVCDGAPYLHDGSVRSLAELLSPRRLLAAYTGGAHGAGAIAGHEFGFDLRPTERAALIAFLCGL